MHHYIFDQVTEEDGAYVVLFNLSIEPDPASPPLIGLPHWFKIAVQHPLAEHQVARLHSMVPEGGPQSGVWEEYIPKAVEYAANYAKSQHPPDTTGAGQL